MAADAASTKPTVEATAGAAGAVVASAHTCTENRVWAHVAPSSHSNCGAIHLPSTTSDVLEEGELEPQTTYSCSPNTHALLTPSTLSCLVVFCIIPFIC